MNYVVTPGEMEEWEIFPGSKIRLAARGEKMTAVLSSWEPGSRSDPHSHPNEQVAFCLEGAMVFKIGDREVTARKGDVVLIPADAPHHQWNEGAKTAVFAEVFSPVREDLLRRTFDPRLSRKE